jgi:diguanylate cyclase (GGDEF)-like protein
MHDSLTGLPNRRMFQERLSQAFTTAEDRGVLAVFLIDLNRFKEVNDTLGHHVGDIVLREVGQRLKRALRASDIIARLGGDEFGVILIELDGSGMAQVARKILHALTDPLAVDGQPIDVTASIGIAQYPHHGTDAATLLKHADVAMYAAKRRGGGYMSYNEEGHVLDMSMKVSHSTAPHPRACTRYTQWW